MVAFYSTRVLTLSATEERKKNIWFDKNLTHDFRTTSRCAGYLRDSSGGEGICMVTHIASVRIFWYALARGKVKSLGEDDV